MADDTAQAIVENEKFSVRQFSPSSWGGLVGDSMGFFFRDGHEMLPAWGSYECDLALRVLDYKQHNALWGGASKVWLSKVIGTPFEISGGKNLTYKWQDLFFNSDFGEGYDFMMTKFLTDYLTLNRGGFLEKVSYGAPDTPLKDGARIIGLNHLDAMRIYFTGNREWPYVYQSEWGGGFHKLHYTRVIHLADRPSPDTSMFGMGKSALYDSLTVVNSQILLGKHQNELLSDVPPPGIILFNNIKQEEVETAMAQFDFDRIRDGQEVYRAPIRLSSKDQANPATVTFIPLATVPEGFDYDKYMRTHVNILALTMQLDPQDIWPLATSAMGSGQQSEILQEKSNNRGPGYVLTRLEREFNTTMPRSLELKFKAQNTQQDLQIATTAKTWNDLATSADYMTADEKRQLMANQAPAFADVLLDENGQVRLYDADPKEPVQMIIAPSAPQLAAPPDAAGTDVTANSQTEIDTPTDTPDVTTKDIDATTSAYTDEIAAAMQDAQSGTITKSVFGSRMRGIIVRYGKAAYQDGLETGGVDPNELDEDDKRLIADYNVWDSTYVTDLANEIYSEAGLKGSPDVRAPLWVSTLNRFYYGGVASADANGMYEFVGDDGIESCKDCKRLKGQVHRMKDWVRRQLVPGIDHDNFECGTWEPNCSHSLEKTDARAKGNW